MDNITLSSRNRKKGKTSSREKSKGYSLERRYNSASKQRIVGIDIIRILCALLIYMRHSITMYGCSYGNFADPIIIQLTAPVMTSFFVISGFSLYYTYGGLGDFTGDKIRKFYAKRALAILPAYYFVHLVWLLFNMDRIRDWIILTPIEITGVQSFFNTLFGIIHNGGSWFVSCMLLCYCIYPIVQMVVYGVGKKEKYLMLCAIYFLSIYSYYIVARFSLESNYSNPLFRMMEFICGVLVASVLIEEKRDTSKNTVSERGGGGKIFYSNYLYGKYIGNSC